MTEASRGAETFAYERPETDRPKTIVWLARTDHLFADVQVVHQGGETNLHSHSHLDGFWFVLSGQARFYGEGNRLLGEPRRHEGILLPRGTPYWFESVGPEPLEILQIESSDVPITSQAQLVSDRTDHAPASRSGAADQRSSDGSHVTAADRP